MKNQTFRLEGMGCPRCKARVEQLLLATDGVERAEAIVETSTLHLVFNPEKAPAPLLQSLLAEAGYRLVLPD